LSQVKKYHTSGNLKFNNLGIFQSLKLRILILKILPISLKVNFTRNTLGDNGLNMTKSRDLATLVISEARVGLSRRPPLYDDRKATE